MAELHNALKYLAPVDWSDVPHDNLEQYLTEAFTAGELICNSIPQLPNGTPFAESTPHHTTPNSATSHKDMHNSAARQHPPHQEHADLAKNWGKPYKFSAKENPLQVSLYKMAGHDRHGAWFARRSVHEGLGFAKWKKAVLREFSETMAVKGGPGAGAIRGLAADRRLEKQEVDGVGKLEVYQLSAQFPGPVTPRDFVEILMGTDEALSDKSAASDGEGGRHVPRHFMVVSKPVEHPDAPARSGYVRGHYESVEMIREIPLAAVKSKSTSDLSKETEHTTANQDTADASNDPELNPVEWIMITRSDPGGGIPRFLVDRGTPETMIQDVHKFFNWACSQDQIADPDEGLDEQATDGHADPSTDGPGEGDKAVAVDPAASTEISSTWSSTAPVSSSTEQPTAQNGVISNLTSAIGASIDSYAPASVSNLVHSHFNGNQDEDLSDDSSDTSSIDSFLSASELRRASTAPEHPPTLPNASADALSVASGDVSEASTKNMSHHEKEIHKLAQKREKLDQQLAKKRIAEEAKLRQAQEKEESDASKAREEMEKRLRKTEEKHKKEIEKLEQKKVREQRKAEEKAVKKDDAKKLSLVTRERDEFRSQSDLFRRENELLREQVRELQVRLGAKEGLGDVGHSRGGSVVSGKSVTSADSGGKDGGKA